MAEQTLFGTLVLALTAFSAGAGFVLAAYGVSRPTAPARAYGVVSALAAGWSVASLVQLAAPSPALAQQVYPFVVIFAILSPFAWLAFCLVWTDRSRWLTHPVGLAVFAEPFAFLALFLSGVAPGLVNPDAPTVTFSGLTLVESTTAPLETFQVLFIYAVITAAMVLLGHAVIETRRIYRRQTALLLAGSVFVFATNVVWYVGLSPHPALDLTPVLTATNAVVAGYAIFGYGALRRLPVTASAIIDALCDPVVVVDIDGTVMDANDAALHLLPDLAVGHHIDETVPGVERAASSGTTYTIPDGSSNDIYEINVSPATDSGGDTIAYTYHFQDVTHRVHREETLSALHVASRRFTTAETREEVAEIACDALVDALSFDYAGVLLYDPETDQLSPTALTDELAEAMGGAGPITPGESFLWPLYESGASYFGPVPDDERHYADVPLAAVAVIPLGDHGLLGAGSVDEEHESLTDARFLELLATTTQASLDRAERTAELKDQREQVAAQHDRIEFFNSLLRHDLLNGLMIVRGHVELLEAELETEASDDAEATPNAGVTDDAESAQWRDRLDVVDRWTNDMAELIQRIRSVIDTLSGGNSTLLQPTELGPLLREKSQKLAATYDSVTVRTQIEDTDVMADALLGDVLGNVLFNAVEHHDRDVQHVDVSSTVTDERVVIRIADDGPGVPNAAKQSVFEKDYTTRGDGTLGFGLYFVAVTVDRYGGSVHFEDNHPRGSIVVIELPRANSDAVDQADDAAPVGDTHPDSVSLPDSGPDPTDS